MSTFQSAITLIRNRPKRTGAKGFTALSTADGKKQLEIATAITRHDSQIDELITEAMDQVETDTPWVAATATHTMQYDNWPRLDEPIVIPSLPVSSITSLKYYDTDGTQQTLASSKWRFDTHRTWPVIWRADLDVDWPDLEVRRPEAIELTFVAGQADLATLKSDAVWMRQAALVRMSLLWHDRGLGMIDYDKATRVYESIIARHRSTEYLL